ncbi:MAG: phosphonate ABC transporter, permease protein PhnE, partial [Anaerolineaceae bacterium]|nr:phosphonate ABC transporter, permease protein PhnE [Anaerolineaceae bacterium]
MTDKRTTLATILSLLVPGAGQAYLGRRQKGLVILVLTALLGFLVAWSFTEDQVGQFQLGAAAFTWLWLPFLLFWAWNVFDARTQAQGKPSAALPAVLFAAIILYVIAWNVTEIKLDRLITRFPDAKIVLNKLVNPEIFVVDVGGETRVCEWKCIGDYYSAKLAGRTPAQSIRLSDNMGDIFGRIKTGIPPRWMVRLGLSPSGTDVTFFNSGTMIETIAIGLLATIFSTILAIPVSFLAAHNIMSRFPGGLAIYYLTRTLLNVVRAVDTIVWGLIVIVWVGQGTYAGVIALSIHSIAALGKLFSEEIEHIDPGPVEALTATGANLLQTIRYGVLPQIVPPFLAYSLLRWDINMRSATIIGFVAGGGIGFFVVETVRLGAYQQYATALWAVAVVIILVDYVSERWRDSILSDQPVRKPPRFPALSALGKAFYVLLGAVVLVYFWNLTKIDLAELFNPGPTFARLVTDFLKIDLSPAVLALVTRQMLITIFQAMLATTLGALAALPFSFLAARNITGRNPASRAVYLLARGVLNLLRSIEALLYVAIFIFWAGVGPFAGMLALAVTTFGLIGKLFSEAIENIETGAIEAVAATGANIFQIISFAILPQIVPPFISYLIYQWDINIRMATIIGFAGGGGIGLTLSTFFGSLQYHKAGTVILFIVVVVALMDFTSARLRQQLV